MTLTAWLKISVRHTSFGLTKNYKKILGKEFFYILVFFLLKMVFLLSKNVKMGLLGGEIFVLEIGDIFVKNFRRFQKI